ncbi:hypothetical protein GZH47_27110 [Paenibacillus rhizovicinus]|uniref:Uncharacterized protein n=1 Tax=Paenibacillus rhizovicinus TaxID=2704463 RepID=A0A6C0PBT7_9BACL|nr:hypothetical protein [Paenibacillus rhizovicinus]QHW34102.1 hypothetical protein GZH47_27110 [Paenibacillus rhizovicinus]
MVLDTDTPTATEQLGKRNMAAASIAQLGKRNKTADPTTPIDNAHTMAEHSAHLGKEMELVRHYALLGIVNVILEHDIRIAGAAPTKLPRLYESMMRGLQDRVLLELAGLRMQFKGSGIGICNERRTKDSLITSYRCMGCERSFSMPWTFVKAEAERLLKGYFEIKKR